MHLGEPNPDGGKPQKAGLSSMFDEWNKNPSGQRDIPVEVAANSISNERGFEREIGLPENWEEVFNNNTSDHERILIDSKNLFTINSNKYGIRRNYHSFDTKMGRFTPRAYAFFDEPHRLGYVLVGNSMWTDSKSIDFQDIKGRPPVAVLGHFGDRDLEVGYDTAGELTGITFKIVQLGEDDGFKETTGYIAPDGDSVGDFNFNVDKNSKDGLSIKRVNREVTDEIFVPHRIDIRKAKEELFHSILRNDPANPNTNLDLGWKDVDPFQKVGVRWTPLADDSLHSLKREHK